MKRKGETEEGKGRYGGRERDGGREMIIPYSPWRGWGVGGSY